MRVLVFVITTFGLLLAGCAPAAPAAKPAATEPQAQATASLPKAAPTEPATKPAAASATPKPVAEQPKYGSVLLTNVVGNPPSSDIHQESTLYVLYSFGPAYNSLVKYDPFKVGHIIGDLAERWDVSADGKVYTFYLHKNLKWHDGQPFSAEDVKYSLDRIRKPPRGTVSQRQMALSTIKDIEVADKDTVRIILSIPHAAFVSMLSTGWEVIMPKHIIESKGNMKKDVIGTGPFRFVSYESGVGTELKKNSDYFVTGHPYLDGLKVYIIADPTTRFAALRTKRLLMTGQTNGLTAGQVEIIEREKLGINVARTEGMVRWELPMRNDLPPWNDVRVRRAVDLALDRQGAIRIASDGSGAIGVAVPPNHPMAIPQAEVEKLPGYRQPKEDDIAEAKRLLAEAGYPRGFDTQVLFRAGATWEKGAVYYKDQLAKIGINAALDGKEAGTFSNRLFEGGFAVSAYKSSSYGWEPEFLLGEAYLTGGGKNYSKFSDKEFDGMFGELRQTMDPAKRKELILKMQRRILDAVPFVLSHWETYLMGLWPEVRNYLTLTDAHANNKWQEVWLAN